MGMLTAATARGRRGPALATLAILTATTAAADVSCSFTTECYDTEGCAETSYDLEVAMDTKRARESGDAGTARFSDVAGDAEGYFTTTDALTHAFVGDPQEGPSRDLLIGADGAARLVILSADGPSTIVYSGTCETL